MIRSLLFATAFIAGALTVSAQTEKFVAVQEDEQTINFTDNKFGTANLEGEIVPGKTIKTISETGEVLEWNDINTSVIKKTINGVNGEVPFNYVTSTGNPYVSFTAEKVEKTTDYRALYTYYLPDGSNGLPKSGLYYKFTPKKNGSLKMAIWVNKGNRETFFVEESSKLPVPYTAEGYIPGQNDQDGKNVFFTNDDLIAQRSGTNSEYVIGGGNRAFFGWITATVEANKTYYLFLHSAQIGFNGYEFTPEGTTGIAKTSAVSADETIYTINGVQTNNLESGKIYIKGGKKFIAK